MTTVVSEPGLSGLVHARGVVRAAAETELWSLTDRQLAAEVADAIALRAQAPQLLAQRLEGDDFIDHPGDPLAAAGADPIDQIRPVAGRTAVCLSTTCAAR